MCRGKCGTCEVLSTPHPQKKDAKFEAAGLLLEEVRNTYGDYEQIRQQKKAQKEAKVARVMGRGRGFGNRPAPYGFNRGGGYTPRGRGGYQGGNQQYQQTFQGSYNNYRGGGLERFFDDRFDCV